MDVSGLWWLSLALLCLPSFEFCEAVCVLFAIPLV